MGTSSSHPSPRTLGWQAVQAGYLSDIVPLDRIAQEVWRASREPEGGIHDFLKTPVLYACYSTIRDCPSVTDAVPRVNRLLATSGESSVVTELARRAVVQAYSSTSPAQSWLSRLFGEVTSYLVTRDLSGYIGPTYRNATARDALQFTAALRAQVERSVAEARSAPRSANEWESYVTRVLAHLTGQR